MLKAPAGPRFARRLTTAVLAAGALLAAPAAQAADTVSAGGHIIADSGITISVPGGPGLDGSVGARFTGAAFPLFWGSGGMTGLTDTTAMTLGVHVNGAALRTPQAFGQVNGSPFTYSGPATKTGTGTAADPVKVVSTFDLTASLEATQTVTHVNGTNGYSLAWEVTNTGGSPESLKVVFGGDTEIPDTAVMTSTLTGTGPTRVLANVGADGTRVELHERGDAPWSHYFANANSSYWSSMRSLAFTNYPDTINAAPVDVGLGAQWNRTVAGGATETFAVDVQLTPPTPQAALVITGLPSGATPVASAAPVFAKGEGDTATKTFECKLDSAAWAVCVAPLAYKDLADGEHTFSVRGVSWAGVAGAEASHSWTVDATAPGAPTLGDKPAARTTSRGAAFTIAGEQGATLFCSFDGGRFRPCVSPYGLSGLTVGTHTFAVMQTDAVGNTSTAASHSWTVYTPPCTSQRVVTLRLKVPSKLKASKLVVTVDGQRVQRVKGSARTVKVSLVGRPGGVAKVQVKTSGKKPKVVASKTYKLCTAGK